MKNYSNKTVLKLALVAGASAIGARLFDLLLGKNASPLTSALGQLSGAALAAIAANEAVAKFENDDDRIKNSSSH